MHEVITLLDRGDSQSVEKATQRASQLRTPRLREILESLRRAGLLAPREYADLVGAYYFLRRLINGLRMLRGSAQDLFLPLAASDELMHLARRMGYEGKRPQTPASLLMVEFETRTAAVQQFVERHFGQPCPEMNEGRMRG